MKTLTTILLLAAALLAGCESLRFGAECVPTADGKIKCEPEVTL